MQANVQSLDERVAPTPSPQEPVGSMHAAAQSLEERISPKGGGAVAERTTSEQPAAETPNPDEPQIRSREKLTKQFSLGIIATLVVISASVAGLRFYQNVATHEETDDAYVTSHLHQVSSRINGTVEKVFVDDNEHVKKGQVLCLIDPRDYQARVDIAQASLIQAQRQATASKTSIGQADTSATGQSMSAEGGISNAEAAIGRAEAAVREAQSDINVKTADLKARNAELDRAELDYKRYETLEQKKAVTTSARDAALRDSLVAKANKESAERAIDQSNARLEESLESVRTAKAQLVQAHGQMQQAKASHVQTNVNKDTFQTFVASAEVATASLKQAELDLSYTKIIAPVDGRVGKKTVEVGQRVEPGQPLLVVVADHPWVVANFKETQLKKMKAGQEVDMTIDSFADHKFTGTLLNFAPGSGSSFAVLPSDNATGNFTKIVQRVPVKIVFDQRSLEGYEDKLAPGMSVITRVDISK